MCGTIKYEHTAHKIGYLTSRINHPIAIYTEDRQHLLVKWLGHIREESGLPKLYHEVVKIYAYEYTEKSIPFKVDKKQAIKGFLIYSQNYPGGRGLFIQTRPATKKELERCPSSPRHPVLIDK
jgi:hypothetical protein